MIIRCQSPQDALVCYSLPDWKVIGNYFHNFFILLAYSRLIKLNDSCLIAVFSYNLKSNKGLIALLMATVWWLVQQR